MKGRSIWNNPSIRKRDIYRLLLKLNGEARWKDLKANLKDLGWGPTTLKQTLDDMVEEGSVIKEARLGAKGPEAWYRVQIKDDDIWAPFKRALDKEEAVSMEQIRQGIKDKAQKLTGKEREVFLKAEMRRIAEMTRDAVLAELYMAAKGAFKKMEKTKLLIIFDYLFDVVLKKHVKEYMKIFMDYPEQSMEVLLDFLITEEDKKEEALRAEGLRK